MSKIDQIYLQTRFYKKIRYIIWRFLSVFVLLGLLVVGLFYLESKLYTAFTLIVLFGLPILASFKKTWFSLKVIDKRIITFFPNQIAIGLLQIDLNDCSAISVYIRSYDGLRLFNKTAVAGKFMPKYAEYGDKNTIQFEYKKEKFDITFLIGSADDYFTLLQIAHHWQEQYQAKVGCEFSYLEISTQVLQKTHSID